MKIKPTNLCITIPLLMMISMGCFANELEKKKAQVDGLLEQNSFSVMIVRDFKLVSYQQNFFRNMKVVIVI